MKLWDAIDKVLCKLEGESYPNHNRMKTKKE